MILNSIQLRLLWGFVIVLCWCGAVRSLLRSDCRCKLGARRRIVGGRLAEHFVPWQVALFHSGSFTCSGFILNEDHIATAQHCITGRLASNLKVVVGVTSLREIDAELIFGVSKAMKHPEFTDYLLVKGHDFAILKLSKRIKFKVGQIEPACIKHQTFLLKEPIMVSGFGATSTVYIKNGLRTSYVPSNDLKYAHFKELKSRYSNEIIYVQSINASDSTCSGDSGSPVSFNEKGKTLVIGLNSFGDVATRNGTRVLCYGSSGFCRLSHERSFIEKQINKNYCLV